MSITSSTMLPQSDCLQPPVLRGAILGCQPTRKGDGASAVALMGPWCRVPESSWGRPGAPSGALPAELGLSAYALAAARCC